MYLILIVVSVILLIIQDWRIGLPIAVIVFCLDRIMDNYRNELEAKKADKKKN